MEVLNYLNNTARSTEFHTYTFCLPEENPCVKDHGYCAIDKKNQTKCLCFRCFIGERCEHEISRNIWQIGINSIPLQDSRLQIGNILISLSSFCYLFNGLLCVQTYLCRKIRQTNLGVYLIILSLISVFLGLFSLTMDLMFLYFEKPSEIPLFTNIVCVYARHIVPAASFMFNWFIAVVAIERVLVQCSVNYSLHDSRHRSIKSSLFILIICPLSTLSDVFTTRDDSSKKNVRIRCQNLTEIGYILHEIIRYIHFIAFYFIYIIMNIIVLIKLIRRRQRFVENESTFDQIRLILRKHKDFFIPYLVLAFGQLPDIILNFVSTCSTANTRVMVYAEIIANILNFVVFAMTFYLYVCLSPVYLSIFWDLSPVGKCLVKIRHKLCPIYKDHVRYNNIPLESPT